MGNRILFRWSHFGAGQWLALIVRLGAGTASRLIVGHEQRVVAETMLAARLTDNDARHFAEFHCFASDGVSRRDRSGAAIRGRGVGRRQGGRATICHLTGHVGTSFGIRHHQSCGATEAGGAFGIWDVFDLCEQQCIVGLVMTVGASPAGGQDAGGVAHHVNDEAGIVRDGGQTGTAGHVAGLEQGVFLEGHAGFHRVGKVETAGRHQFDVDGGRAEILLKDAADFNELTFVMSGDNDLHDGFLAMCVELPLSRLQRQLLLKRGAMVCALTEGSLRRMANDSVQCQCGTLGCL